jgi:hypothetical protein
VAVKVNFRKEAAKALMMIDGKRLLRREDGLEIVDICETTLLN